MSEKHQVIADPKLDARKYPRVEDTWQKESGTIVKVTRVAGERGSCQWHSGYVSYTLNDSGPWTIMGCSWYVKCEKYALLQRGLRS